MLGLSVLGLRDGNYQFGMGQKNAPQGPETYGSEAYMPEQR